MNYKAQNQTVSFIWGTADDVFRVVFVRGKYRDIILPFTVLRRLDLQFAPSKDKVLEAVEFMEKENINFGYFYSYVPSCGIEEITADILQLEKETDGILNEIIAN